LALKTSSPAAFDFFARVALCYASLFDTSLADPEIGLGGKLFYAGELDDDGRALVVAANIAGAATLAVSADPAAQKQALRDGVVDFVVTNLDEALRILKNQLRKRESVSVCVAQSLPKIDGEIGERGVAPDLLRGDLRAPQYHEALLHHEGEENELDLGKIPALVTWRVDSALPKDLALLDEIALACLDPEGWKSRRWLRLSPRYLGRLAHGLRLLETQREFATRFIEKVEKDVGSGEIAVPVEVRSYFRGTHDDHRFVPSKR
jgi:hypothetical protein